MPRCIVEQPRQQAGPRLRQPTDPNFIYEIGVKAFTREKSEEVKFRAAADDLMNQQIVIARLFTFLMPLIFKATVTHKKVENYSASTVRCATTLPVLAGH